MWGSGRAVLLFSTRRPRRSLMVASCINTTTSLAAALASIEPQHPPHYTTTTTTNKNNYYYTRSSAWWPASLPFHHQRRYYIFFPTSWSEFRERTDRWLEDTESRIVQVQLSSQQFQARRQQQYDTFKARRKDQYFQFKSRRQQQYYTLEARRRQHYTKFKIRRAHQYRNWKVRRQTQYTKFKVRRRQQYQDFVRRTTPLQQLTTASSSWRRKAKQRLLRAATTTATSTSTMMLTNTYNERTIHPTPAHQDPPGRTTLQPVRVDEYSQPEWFCPTTGRPFTATDPTGHKFVNPWQSQSTQGIHALSTLLQWRYQRWRRQSAAAFAWWKQRWRSSGWPRLARSSFDTITTTREEARPTPSLPPSSTSTSTSSPVPPSVPKSIPVLAPSSSSAVSSASSSPLHCTWIGHATCVFQIPPLRVASTSPPQERNQNNFDSNRNNNTKFTIITDPMFSHRASPLQHFLGVTRDIPPAFSIQDILEAVNTTTTKNTTKNTTTNTTSKNDIKNADEVSNSRNSTNHDTIDSYKNKNANQKMFATTQTTTTTSTNTTPEDDNYIICCITHNHYDHLDLTSVLELQDHVQLWVVPLGLKDWLLNRCWWIDPQNILELRWWEAVHITNTSDSSSSSSRSNNEKRRRHRQSNDNDDDHAINPKQQQQQGPYVRVVGLGLDNTNNDNTNNEALIITCCPASHWSGRNFLDRNESLWCSFAFSTPTASAFFCGDTGYPRGFPLFRQIGFHLGPFDLACIPIGAYEPEELNKDAHCNPTEAVQIHIDLQSNCSIPIHFGSFQLTEESMEEPPQKLEEAINKHRLKRSVGKWFNEQGRLVSNDTNNGSDDDADATGNPSVNFKVLGHGDTLIL